MSGVKSITRSYTNTADSASGSDELIVELMKALIGITDHSVIKSVKVNVEYHEPTATTGNGRVTRKEFKDWLRTQMEEFVDYNEPVPTHLWVEFRSKYLFLRAEYLNVTRVNHTMAKADAINRMLTRLNLPYHLEGEMLGCGITVRRT